MKKVICFGEILWDNLPTGRLAGGAPMNVAYHLRKLGVDASLISRIGNDTAGTDLLSFISSIKLPTNLIQIDQHHSTSEVIGTLTANNEMTYTITYPTAWDFIEWENSYTKLIEETEVFIYGSLASRNEVSANTLLKILEIAPYKVFDVNLRAPHYTSQSINNLLIHANLVKVNENEIDMLGKWFTAHHQEEDQVNALREKFNIEEIIVTRGANGSSYYGEKEVRITQESLSVKVVDTVGSGDAFLAGFVTQKLAGKPILNCFKYANRLAAFITTRAGACPDYSLGDIKHLQSTNFYT